MRALRRRRWPVILAAWAVLAGWPAAVPGLPPIVAGMRLQEALRLLQKDGVRVVYSTALVPWRLRVKAPPAPGSAEQVLRELLTPHGLDVRPALGERFLVVRRPTGGGPSRERAYVAAEAITVETTTPELTDPRTGARSFGRAALPQLSTGTALTDALGTLPGTTGADVMAAAHVRGSGAGELEVRLDGVDIQAAPRLGGLQSLLGVVDSQALERIDLLAGGYPAQLGASLGGILNLVPAASDGARTEVSLGTLGGRVLGSGRWGESGSWLLAARGGEIGDGFATRATVYEGLQPRYLDAFARLERPLGEGKLSVSGYHATDSLRLPLTAQQRIDHRDERTTGWVTLERPWTQGAWGRSRLVWGRGAADHQVLVRIPGADEASRSAVRHVRRTDFTRAHLSQEWTYRTGRHLASAGLEVYRETAAGEDHETRQRIEGPPRALLAPLRLDGSAIEGYLSDRLDLGGGRSLELGARVERQSWAGTTISPRLNLVWPLAGGMVRLGAGRFTQAQHLYRARLEPGLRDPRPPQLADQLVVGYERRWAGALLQLETYRTRLSALWPRLDEQLTAPSQLAGEPSGVILTPRAARLQGIDLLASGRLGPTLDGLFSYSWSEASEEIAGATVRRDWDQRHTLDGYLDWRPRPPLSLRLRGLYGSGWPHTRSTATTRVDDRQHTVVVVTDGPRNAEQRAASWRLDLGSTFDLRLRGESLALELALLNVANHANVAAVAGYEHRALVDRPLESWRVDLLGLRRTAVLALHWRR